MKSKLLLLVLLFSCLVFVAAPRTNTVQALGTIYIRADGSVDPPTPLIQRNGDVYTLTGNISTTDADIGIVIERDNIILDGAGYTLQGRNNTVGLGVKVSNRNSVTVENMNTKDSTSGIELDNSSNCNVVGNSIALHSGMGRGIMLYYSSNNSVLSTT